FHYLKDTFNFHPLAIEDCQSDNFQTPKVDDFKDYIFIVTQYIQLNEQKTGLVAHQLSLFLGSNFLVSCSLLEKTPPVEEVWDGLNHDERLHENGSDFLCHAILDRLVDGYMPILDQLDEEIDRLEDNVLAKPEPQTLERILALKHNIMALKRVISPMREVMNKLSREDFPQIDLRSRIYFRDIYDHLVRFQDLSESIRDIVSGALDIYLSSTSLRLNGIMKALTIVSTIFLPLTFLAGVYGMNFHFMPELSVPWAYPVLWGIFILLGAGMIYLFKRRGWF
ncbi:MAG: magnesium/cobalt transporter CorA, partial [Anaerolineaceae bacterium]|nr:magnesium/cobalt transporter CorA [Anaerolineaceae bacterium]